ncbi:glycosyl transferase [Kineobactrum sediminis]|uniref:Glycosyl transferase n=1 Tax=Kineobactrum sediminis TaxID=1905677 RepID=A0A2N5Y5N1_9GAMM|nr:glycosyltransferase family 2 protein [Kineobactrum sediminis]PLW83671.1 glycosyl transferase [Kineobactrum sediminis]
MIQSKRGRQLLAALFLAGVGGSLLAPTMLSWATLLLAIAGLWLMHRQVLGRQGWEKPRELRLIHFGCWFFVLVYVLFWIASGFDYNALKELDGPARLIFFWPLVVAITWAKVRADTVFAAFAVAALGAIANVVADIWLGSVEVFAGIPRAGLAINLIALGNLALLSAALTLVGALYWFRAGHARLGWAAAVLAFLALAAALQTQTRSNLVALPVLLLLMLPLVSARYRLPVVAAGLAIIAIASLSSDRLVRTVTDMRAGQLDPPIESRLEIWDLSWGLFVDQPLTGAGLNGYTRAVERAIATEQVTAPEFVARCCRDHTHNDLLQSLATRGLAGGLSWLLLLSLPLLVFARYVRSRDITSAHLAVAGTLFPVGFFVFGLTEAAFSRTLFVTWYLVGVAAIAAALFLALNRACHRQRTVSLSAIVITRDEEAHIGACLQSLQGVVDEIVVLDSGSTDNTVAIAREYTDSVENTDWPGFGVQKQRALERATGEWVLSIDADERLSPQLAAEINHVLNAPDADAYKLPWAVTIYGTRLDFGRSGRAPLRLFRREGVRFSDALVHEKILLPEGRKVRTLRSRLVHYTHRDFGHALLKGAQYAWLGANEKYRQGKKVRTLVYPTLRGLLTFVQVYVLRLGFLDGSVGFLSAVLYAQVSFNKYAGLWTKARPRYGAE